MIFRKSYGTKAIENELIVASWMELPQSVVVVHRLDCVASPQMSRPRRLRVERSEILFTQQKIDRSPFGNARDSKHFLMSLSLLELRLRKSK